MTQFSNLLADVMLLLASCIFLAGLSAAVLFPLQALAPQTLVPCLVMWL